MLPFFTENLPIFTRKFYILHRKTHNFSSKPKNQGIDKKISIPEKSIDTSPITSFFFASESNIHKSVRLLNGAVLLKYNYTRVPTEFANQNPREKQSGTRFLRRKCLKFAINNTATSQPTVPVGCQRERNRVTSRYRGRDLTSKRESTIAPKFWRKWSRRCPFAFASNFSHIFTKIWRFLKFFTEIFF